MLPVILATVVALVFIAAAAALAARRAAVKRRAGDERHRLRRRELELDQEQDTDFRSWRAEELAFEQETKRADAERALRAADVYAQLAEEQELRAAELAEESEDAAARAGLEDIRVRRLEAGDDEAAAQGQ
jgi:hypothetical protein